VAISLTRKAECIYSYDPGVKKFSEGFIQVKEMPIIPEQLSIFQTTKTKKCR
jgi:hypothetical protein